MKNNIPLSNISKLHTDSVIAGLFDGLSPQDLGKWLKDQTNNEYIVIERKFVLEAIDYIDKLRFSDEFIGHDFKERWNLEEIKKDI